MKNREKKPTFKCLWLFPVLFAVLYLSFLHLRELRSTEALAATIAIEMADEGSNPLVTTVHQTQVHAFPLYPWLITLCRTGIGSPEWAVRLPSALAVLAMAGLTALVAAKTGGAPAGAFAAAVILTTPGVLHEGLRATGNSVFAFFMTAAWFSWYRLGREKRRWGSAWMAAILFVLAGTLTVGIRAVALFYFPLFFLKKPLHGRRRMLLPVHFAALAMMAVVVTCWKFQVPDQPLLPWNALREIPAPPAGYLSRLILFPVKCSLFLLPWTFLVWPGFCLAYRPLEDQPVFCSFLRTIITSFFIVVWISPGQSVRSLLPVLCPLAVLSGMHYELIARRHHVGLLRLCRWLLLTVSSLSGATVLLGLCHVFGLIELQGLDPCIFAEYMLLLTGVYTVSRLLYTGNRIASPVWMRMLIAVALLQVIVLSVHSLSHNWLHSTRRLDGKRLADRIPPGENVYTVLDDYLIVRTFYMNRPVIRIDDLEAGLPEAAHTVYVLAENTAPILSSREWAAWGPPVRPGGSPPETELEWMPGNRCLLRISRKQTAGSEPGEQRTVRVYRGELRSPDEP